MNNFEISLERLRYVEPQDSWTEADWTHFKTIKAALEKQIAKEHHHTRVVEINCKARESVCPACLGVIITTENEYPKHCTWCGQALVWREGEERW